MFGQNSSADILYSEKDHKRVRSLLEFQLACMTIIGQRPYIIVKRFPRSLRSLGRFLAYLYSGFVIIQMMHTSIFFAKKTIEAIRKDDLSESSDALTQTIIFGFSTFSTCYWLRNMNTLSKYIDYINKNYWHHSLVGLTYVSSFNAYLKARWISIFWFSCVIFGATLYGFAPFLQRSHTLPLRCWYPFDPLQTWVYPIVYLSQMFAQIVMAITFACGSFLYVSLILLMLGQFDVLFCSLKNLEYHSLLSCGENLDTLREHQQRLPAPIDDEVNQYILLQEQLTDLKAFQPLQENLKYSKSHFQAALHGSIVKCVQLHQFVWECCRILESLYNPYCLIKSLQITVQLCLLVFVGATDEISVVRVINAFQYLVFTLMDLSFYTVCGELLRRHSVRVGEAFWRSDWTSYATLIRKDIIIFLINSQRPIKLTAGKFFVMDIDRFRLVLMQAFSFLTLLQKLAAKNK